VFGF